MNYSILDLCSLPSRSVMPVVDNELVPDRHQGPFIPLDLPLHQWIFDCLQRNLHTHGDGPWIVIKTFTYFLLFVFVYVCAIIFFQRNSILSRVSHLSTTKFGFRATAVHSRFIACLTCPRGCISWQCLQSTGQLFK